jgi:hypothetical protein
MSLTESRPDLLRNSIKPQVRRLRDDREPQAPVPGRQHLRVCAAQGLPAAGSLDSRAIARRDPFGRGPQEVRRQGSAPTLALRPAFGSPSAWRPQLPPRAMQGAAFGRP